MKHREIFFTTSGYLKGIMAAMKLLYSNDQQTVDCSTDSITGEAKLWLYHINIHLAARSNCPGRPTHQAEGNLRSTQCNGRNKWDGHTTPQCSSRC